MAAATGLAERIKAEFDARTQRQKEADQQMASESEAREKRLSEFSQKCEKLKGVWGPRFDEFARQFGEKIKVSPSITPSQREAKVAFLTDLANVNLTLTASISADMKNLVLVYDLQIIPILLDYERHARLEQPLDKIDEAAIGKWLDDRLVDCVRVYLSLRDNEHYVKRAMVEDPITKTRLLREDAKATFEHAGKMYYFSSEDSLRQFKERHKPAPQPVEVKPEAKDAKKPEANKVSSTKSA